MREPAFWWRPVSWPSRALAPLSSIYGFVATRRLARAGAAVGLPVICVGNYHVGGAGKTPVAIALARLLGDAGERPFLLSRGYGGSLEGPVRVDPDKHRAADVGDEPLLLATAAPTIVARDRVAGARLAKTQGASVIVMDDGLQNPSLKKHLALVVVDGARGVGNGRVFPAGPMRAPLDRQLRRTDGLIIIGDGAAADDLAGAVAARGGLVLRARFVPDSKAVADLRGRRVLAFAGIGDPKRFFVTLRAAGIDPAEVRAFADHHPYRLEEIEALRAAARSDDLLLVTTEKDFVRLRGTIAKDISDIAAFPISVAFDNEAELCRCLRKAMAGARTS